jgi:predicted dehydrogenase
MADGGSPRVADGGSPRVALVGYGSSGRGIHAPLLTAAGASPVVVVTGNPERVAQARADLPGVRVLPDLAALLAGRATADGVDLVVLASPSGVHVEQALACVAAGVAVMIDKPIATDAVRAAALVAAARAAQVPLTVFQNRRWDDESRTLAAVLGAGWLGRVHRFERRWERWRPTPKDRWREKASAADGGGLLLDLGSHTVDAALTAFGPVVSVYAELAAWTTAAEDEVFLALQHAGGVRSHLGMTSVAGAPGPRTRVLGERGAYVVTEFESETAGFTPSGLSTPSPPGHTGWLVAGGEPVPVPTPPGGHHQIYPAVLAALRLPADRRQAAMPVQPDDAVQVLRVLDAGRFSAREGCVVTL